MKKLFGIALAISLLGNIALLYRVLDLGVTITYNADETKYRDRQINTMQKLFPVIARNASKADLIKAANSIGAEVIEKKDGEIYVGEVEFTMSENHIVSVKF